MAGVKEAGAKGVREREAEDMVAAVKVVEVEVVMEVVGMEAAWVEVKTAAVTVAAGGEAPAFDMSNEREDTTVGCYCRRSDTTRRLRWGGQRCRTMAVVARVARAAARWEGWAATVREVAATATAAHT